MKLHKTIKNLGGKLTPLLAVVAGFATFAASAVDWQFTGATNRTAAVAHSCAISSEFDSRLPPTILIAGRNFRSDACGSVFVFR